MSNLIYVQKLSHFEVRIFGRISFKEVGKISILGILYKFGLVCQSLSYEAEICTISSLYQDKKVKLNFWKISWTFDFMLFLREKIIIFRYFLHFLVQKVKYDQKFEKQSIESLVEFMNLILRLKDEWTQIFGFWMQMYHYCCIIKVVTQVWTLTPLKKFFSSPQIRSPKYILASKDM